MPTFKDEDIKERVQAAHSALKSYQEDIPAEPYMILNNFFGLITAMINTHISENIHINDDTNSFRAFESAVIRCRDGR